MSKREPTTALILLFLAKGEVYLKCLLLVLNQPLRPQLKLFKTLWRKAVFRAFVDGAANEVYETLSDELDAFLPDILTGDFDSIFSEVYEYYGSKGVSIIKTLDQDFTDFTKCLKICLEKKLLEFEQLDQIVVLGSFGGRLDQEFANINTLYDAKKLTSDPVYLFSSTSVAFLLEPGKHAISIDTGYEGDWCGLIPVGFPAQHVTTTGLKWNLNNQMMKFGELISTSNTFDGSGSPVTIDTDEPLLWIMDLKF